MLRPNIIEFERLIRAYVAREVSWEEVHKFAVEMEWAGATDFPTRLQKPLEALHMAFLAADERDDPQFRMDRSDVSKLLDDLDKAESGMRNPS